MQIYVERGANRGDCAHKIVQKHGPYFTILREKIIPSRLWGIVPEQVEVEYYLSPQRGLGMGGNIAAWHSNEPYTPRETPYLDNRQTLVLPSAMPMAAPNAAPVAQNAPRNDSTLDFVKAKQRVLEAAGKNPEQVFRQVQEQDNRDDGAQTRNQQLIIDTLKEIQERLETGKEKKQEHPSLCRIMQMLRLNEFSEHYIDGIMERARKELSLETLEDFDAVQKQVLAWIGESIKVFPSPGKPWRMIVLIGPTGVGKTTTVAKLAAVYTMNAKRPFISIRMITIDAFKIGARSQIEDFGNIMEIPVSYVDNHDDLRREIDLYREETDLILVDTIGRSPRDSVKLGEMKKLLEACGPKAEIHLVLSASTKTCDIEYALQQFEPFDYQAVLLTKLDETSHVGSIISALAEKGKSISYITDGQAVHKNIKKATVVRFLINLEEFRVDREEFEKRFPAGETDQF